MTENLLLTVVTLVSFIVSMVSYPVLLRFAKRHGIVDNPGSRKLHREPVPVMGGVAVYVGIMAALLVAIVLGHYDFPMTTIIGMTTMLAVGVWDDVRDIPAILRFIVELVLVWGMMSWTNVYIDNFHGLWNISDITMYVSLPLSLVASVGIINAVNLIDGVDGYCSGFGIMASFLFAALFFHADVVPLGIMALTCGAALIPFFLHNVFGRTSKMFIGDGGTLMLGVVMSVFVFASLSSTSRCSELESEGIGLVAFTMAVLSVPVFDTLRVMCTRIVRGVSPFHPDKTHLHHLFIIAGFSHVGTSFSCLLLDLLVVAAWYVSFVCGASVTLQFYIVVSLGFIFTFGLYWFISRQREGGTADANGNREGTALYKSFIRLGRRTHLEGNGIWKVIRAAVDKASPVKN